MLFLIAPLSVKSRLPLTSSTVMLGCVSCNSLFKFPLIGGKWKLLLLRNLKERPWRFNELQRSIDGISQKVLTESLRQMIDDGLAYRRDYHENPPKVEYGLTDLGMEMLPIVNALADFGNYYKSVVDRS